MTNLRKAAAFSAAALIAAALPAHAAESTQAKIARGMTAGPPSIAAGATFIDVNDATGKITVLKKGSNGFSCFVGHPGVVGDDPFCADAAGMQWVGSWMAHKPRPVNAQPGIIYMLAGGTDWSASDPWATKGKPIHEPPHWMLMWPVTGRSGLATTPKNSGTWIMWAGTPYAHLMVNQKP